MPSALCLHCLTQDESQLFDESERAGHEGRPLRGAVVAGAGVGFAVQALLDRVGEAGLLMFGIDLSDDRELPRPRHRVAVAATGELEVEEDGAAIARFVAYRLCADVAKAPAVVLQLGAHR